jgi:Coenzyme PQQ synthesis protein D (PqqD)
VIRKQGDWFSAKVGDEMVMMSAKMGNYIGLSEVGARIFELIETPQDIDAVCAQLLDELEVGARNLPRRDRGISQRTGDAWCGCA